MVAVVWVADEVCAVVAEYIWWITGTLVLCFVLAVAASVALEAWADRRGARFAARHRILSRADVVLSEPVAGTPPPVICHVVCHPVVSSPAGSASLIAPAASSQ